jgi:hypothetical protein
MWRLAYLSSPPLLQHISKYNMCLGKTGRSSAVTVVSYCTFIILEVEESRTHPGTVISWFVQNTKARKKLLRYLFVSADIRTVFTSFVDRDLDPVGSKFFWLGRIRIRSEKLFRIHFPRPDRRARPVWHKNLYNICKYFLGTCYRWFLLHSYLLNTCILKMRWGWFIKNLTLVIT